MHHHLLAAVLRGSVCLPVPKPVNHTQPYNRACPAPAMLTHRLPCVGCVPAAATLISLISGAAAAAAATTAAAAAALAAVTAAMPLPSLCPAPALTPQTTFTPSTSLRTFRTHARFQLPTMGGLLGPLDGCCSVVCDLSWTALWLQWLVHERGVTSELTQLPALQAALIRMLMRPTCTGQALPLRDRMVWLETSCPLQPGCLTG